MAYSALRDPVDGLVRVFLDAEPFLAKALTCHFQARPAACHKLLTLRNELLVPLRRKSAYAPPARRGLAEPDCAQQERQPLARQYLVN